MKRIKKYSYINFLMKYCAKRGLHFVEAYYDEESALIDCYYTNGVNDGILSLKAGDCF